MLNRVDGHNREVVKMKEEFEERRGEQVCCKTCKLREPERRGWDHGDEVASD